MSLSWAFAKHHLPSHTEWHQSRTGSATPPRLHACHSATCPFGCLERRPLLLVGSDDGDDSRSVLDLLRGGAYASPPPCKRRRARVKLCCGVDFVNVPAHTEIQDVQSGRMRRRKEGYQTTSATRILNSATETTRRVAAESTRDESVVRLKMLRLPVLFSVTPVPSCCVFCCTVTCVHRDLVVAFRRLIQKSFHFPCHP